MFTGIVEEMGRIVDRREAKGLVTMTLEAPRLHRELRVGASIAVSGVCLTVVHLEGDRFDLDVSMEIEPKPGIPPSPGRITEVISRVKSEKIEVLLKATYFSKQAVELIASQTGARVVECSMFPGAQPDATAYFTLFDSSVNRLNEAFGGGSSGENSFKEPSND